MNNKKRKTPAAKGWLKLKTTEALAIVVTVLFLEVIILSFNFYLENASQNKPAQNTAAISMINTAEAAPGTLDSYTIEKVMDMDCRQDIDCPPSGEYLVQSRCKFTSKCLGNRCAVVCPGPNNLTWPEALKIINNGSEKSVMLQGHQI